LWKKKTAMFTAVTMSTYQDQLNTGFSKVCEVCSAINAVNLHNILELIIYYMHCYLSVIIGTSTLHSHALKHDAE